MSIGGTRATLLAILVGAGLLAGCTAQPPGASVAASAASVAPSTTPSATPTASASAPPSTAPSGGPVRPAGYVVVAGSHIGLVPPEGFTASATFTGFEHQSGASIVVAELPTSPETVLPGMTDDAFTKQGITVTGREDVTIDGRPGLFITGTQAASGLTFHKLLLVTGTTGITAVLNANYLDEPAGIGEDIRSALETVGIDAATAVDPAAALTFVITPAAPLRFGGALSNAAVYNASGKLPAADPLEPTFIAAPSIDKRIVEPTEATAKDRVMRLAYRNISIEATKPLMIGDLHGYGVFATALRTKTDDKVFVYSVMLFPDDGGYVLMTGECRIGEREALTPVFVATAASYRPKPA